MQHLSASVQEANKIGCVGPTTQRETMVGEETGQVVVEVSVPCAPPDHRDTFDVCLQTEHLLLALLGP